MAHEGDARSPYAVPRYRESGEPAWYHVLHGTVPGHQIDFIYCPDVPQGPLTQTHFAHVARLIKYIEPREQASFAFALGNLSRDDVQHDPGHGGIALIFGLRVAGVVDHASRAMPPYAHGLLAVDRALDYGALIEAITAFQRRFLHEGPEDATGSFYREYVQTMRERPHAVEGFLRAYVEGFGELPRPDRSALGWDFVASENARLDRITIVHPDREPFSTVASVAAALGAVLYRSNVKWTTISNSREFDIPGGVSVRFVPEGELPRDPRGRVLRLDDIPADEAEMAEKLFSAKPRSSVRRARWHMAAAPAPEPEVPLTKTSEASTAEPGAIALAGPKETGAAREEIQPHAPPAPKNTRRVVTACVLATAMAGIVIGRLLPEDEPARTAPSSTPTAPPAPPPTPVPPRSTTPAALEAPSARAVQTAPEVRTAPEVKTARPVKIARPFTTPARAPTATPLASGKSDPPGNTATSPPGTPAPAPSREPAEPPDVSPPPPRPTSTPPRLSVDKPL